MRFLITRVKARYIHGTGRNTRMFHLINLGRVDTWHTDQYKGQSDPDDPGWAGITLYTGCGQREMLTDSPRPNSLALAADPPKGLKPCPRCFARWEKLGKPLTAEQWDENARALRVMTSLAARAKRKG